MKIILILALVGCSCSGRHENVCTDTTVIVDTSDTNTDTDADTDTSVDTDTCVEIDTNDCTIDTDTAIVDTDTSVDTDTDTDVVTDTDTAVVDTDTSIDTDTGIVPGAVCLGTAKQFTIIAKSGVSTVPISSITGDIGVSPIAATGVTGFSMTMDSSNEFSTSDQVVGKVYAADYSPPTPSYMTTAVGDMEIAFTDAAGRAADFTELAAGDISGMTLYPGTYKWSTGLLISTDIWIEGSATDVWIFEIAQDLTVANAVQIHLTGGALPENVFWQVSGAVTIETTAHVEGVILSQTSIILKTGASVHGRLLAQTAVVLDQSVVVGP